jgi:uncharacterized membrane protein
LATTVPAHALARPRTATFCVGALALAGGTAVHLNELTTQCLNWTGLVILVLVVVIVVPAVWSLRKSRRDAALAVLDRLLALRR